MRTVQGRWAPARGDGALHRHIGRHLERPKVGRCHGILDSIFRGGQVAADDVAIQSTTELPDLYRELRDAGLPPQLVYAETFPGTGRGLRAAGPIPKGEPLLRVPQQLLITAPVALENAVLGPAMAAAGVPDWTALAVFLAELRLGAHADDGRPGAEALAGGARDGSPALWTRYAATLPEETGCVLEWGTGEAERLLQGSPLAEKATAILDAEQASWDQLESVLASAQREGALPTGYTLPREAVRWGFCMLLSRLVRMDDLPDGAPEALVPWADLANHKSDVGSFLCWKDDAVTLTTDQAYREGEQVFISYGQKPPGELWLSYGFCMDPSSDMHDAYLMTWEVDPSDTFADEKIAALAKQNWPARETFPVRLEGWPNGMQQYATFCSAKFTDVDDVKPLCEMMFGHGVFPVLDGVDLEAFSYECIRTRCEASLASYGSKKPRDKLLSKKLSKVDAMSDCEKAREVQAAALKMRERSILDRTAFVCTSSLAALDE